MIKIAIIEDDKKIREIISDKVKSHIDSTRGVLIHTYDSAESFLEKLDAEDGFHIVFSDIEMHEMNGIELGKRLKALWPNVYLIFITAHTQFAADSYCVEAYQYVLKTEMNHRLPKIIQEVVEKVEAELDKTIVVGSTVEQQVIRYGDILWIRKVKNLKYVEYITWNQAIRERSTVEQAMERLNSQEFVLVDRSCIVNMRFIDRIKDNTICLSNGDEICVSRLRMTRVKEEIHRYWGEM